MKYCFLFLFLIISFKNWAQPGVSPVEEINGKKYYSYIVQGGNTLFGIHQLFNIPVQDIINVNPGIEKGVNEGQRILIPFTGNVIKNSSDKTHKVEAKETLFGISKKYGVKAEDIIALNPGVENGVKIGQELKIPESESGFEYVPQKTEEKATFKSNSGTEMQVVFADTVIMHTVLPHETMYSISKRFMVPVSDIQQINGLKTTKIKNGDIVKIPVKKEKIQEVQIREIQQINSNKVDSTLLYKKKSEYSIALMLPFNLSKSEGNGVKALSNAATEFYMGFKLAIDSLEKLGLKSKVYVYDSKNDSISIVSILKKPEFREMDMVFGPILPDKMNIVADWCKQNKVKHICPVAANASILKNNPFVFTAVPSEMTQMEGLAKYILSLQTKDQVILLKSKNAKDKLLYESFRQAFLSLPSKGIRPKLIEIQLDEVSTFVKKGLNTTFIVPSTDKTVAISFINKLNANMKSITGEITVFGTKEWVNFDEIDNEYKNKYHFTYASPNDLNYSYENTKSLEKIYREEFNADMSKVAVQGFDVMLYFGQKYLLEKDPKAGIMSDFEMLQKGNGNGFENNKVFIIKQEDFELKKIYETHD